MKIKSWEDLDNVENSLFKLRKYYCGISVDFKDGEKDNILAVDVEKLDKATVLSILKLFGFDIEFEEQPKLTEQEWHMVRAFPDGFWVRDKGEFENVFISLDFPKRQENFWDIAYTDFYALPNSLFPFIKWEDEKPWTSEQLRKLEKI